MSDTVIKTESLCFDYNSVPKDNIEPQRENPPAALDDISITVGRGEFIAVLGHNGSGKSTLAKHINALLTPTSGTVWINGMDTRNETDLWNIRQSAGMVFQNPDNQIVATIVEEDVAFGPENIGVPSAEIRERVDSALDTVRMRGCSQSPPHCLSGGQKQRVAIAGVLAMKPGCIVLDEPTAMLDPTGRREVLETVRRLNADEGITVVFITHFMDEAVAADRIIVMDGGGVAADGTPKEIFSQAARLREYGLGVPQVTEIAYKLKESEIDLPDGILTADELVEALCTLK